MNDHAADDSLVLSPDDDGLLFVTRVLTSGEERVARYCYRALNGRELRFPMFYDPERPGDYTRWVHVGGDAVAVRRLPYMTPALKPDRCLPVPTAPLGEVSSR